MKYKNVPIDEIRPDPNQPRKHFDQEALEEMAVSIKNEGIINAIEIDEHDIIITGEQRWRSAKIAGESEVPVKVVERLTEHQRFVRQVQENIHHNSMSPLDTAMALEKIRASITPSGFDRDDKHSSNYFGKGLKELHNLLGLSENTIREYLDLLGIEGTLKEALKEPGFTMRKARAVKRVPAQYKEDFSEFIGTQKKISSQTAGFIGSAINRAVKYGEESKIKNLFDEDYEGISGFEARNKIDKIIPTEEARIKEPADAAQVLGDGIIALLELLEAHPLTSLDDFHRNIVSNDINRLGAYLGKYLQESKKLT